ncbi:MAG: hypothetical protein Q8S19_09480 [Bacillota bacterium]|nr:hypothetical protein [Bacillota bacterium]
MSYSRFENELATIQRVTDLIMSKMDLEDPAQRQACHQIIRHLALVAAHLECVTDVGGHGQELITTDRIASRLQGLHETKVLTLKSPR